MAKFFRDEIFSPDEPEARRQAPAEARFLGRALKLKKGSRVLDLCCGAGRHAAFLARRGVFVTGVDSSAPYLKRARKAAGKLKTLRLLRADMRTLPFKAEFDAAYNVWTSFGYFSKAADDLRTLRAVARALKPGGLFLIDVIDYAWLKRNFRPVDWARRGDGSYRLERTELRRGRSPATVSEWTVLRPGRPPRRARFSVRCYDRRSLSALLRQAGLTPLRRCRGLDGNRAPARLVLLGRRAKAPRAA